MKDFIIIVIIAAVVALSLYSTVKHFRGEGGCCGGGGYRIKKKRLKNICRKKVFSVDGMHCERCKGRVEEVINDLPGVSASVNMKKGTLTVFYAEDVPDEVIIARIEKAGYQAKLPE